MTKACGLAARHLAAAKFGQLECHRCEARAIGHETAGNTQAKTSGSGLAHSVRQCADVRPIGAPRVDAARFGRHALLLFQINPCSRSKWMTRSAAALADVADVSSLKSGASGVSYGESIPVKFFSSPRRAFA